MARRTWSDLTNQYADNTSGDIQASDLRDGVIDSQRPHLTSGAPTASNDNTAGFDVGHTWVDTSEPALYECLDAATGAAVWAKVWPQTGAAPTWGGITGTLSDQTDLQSALDAKQGLLATVQSYSGNRTLDSSNSGAYIRITAAGTVTLPDGLPTGFQALVVNATNSDTVELDAGTTLILPSGYDPEIQNRRAVTVLHVGSDVWEAHGALVETP